MSPRMLAEVMRGLESLAVAEVDEQCRQFLDPDQDSWQAEDWDWYEARIGRVHAVFHPEAGERRAAA
jgi:hypothetical protein